MAGLRVGISLGLGLALVPCAALQAAPPTTARAIALPPCLLYTSDAADE